MSPLFARIAFALERIKAGHAPRIPAAENDPDLVLADCEKEILRLREINALYEKQRDEARAKALEEASALAEDWTCGRCDSDTAGDLAMAIRALEPAEPTPEWESESCGTCGGDDLPCKSDGIVWTCRDCLAKAEGGTTFTVCDACWDKHHPPAAEPEACARCYGVSLIRDGSDGSRECPDCGGTGRAR